ncbi:PEP-CTERM sorting domain-containing protein [Duganella aquatilis]|uniref:PEP-CTERM sorting domain-containing protein n=1 Tax=Duganella aquatilis TaxID=2666082 RepID=UPI001E3CB22E|nr:PEP-CTERM sorting domain-containing protein [Duganella aquatilis]
MSIKSLSTAVVLALSSAASTVHATTIDFEGFPTPEGNGVFGYLASAYGFTWTGLYDEYSVVVSPNYALYFGGTPDQSHSGTNYAWTGGSGEFVMEAASFTLNSLWLRTPWATGSLDVKGYKDGVEIYSSTVVISGAYQQKIFDFVGVDKVTFYGNNIGNLLFDDVVVNETPGLPPPVPEPETYALLLAGLGLVGAFVRRRTRA